MLTPLELDIMKAVWRRAPTSVRNVQLAIQPSRPLAYTTVMTIMDRLRQKGFLTRRFQGRTHFYEPVISHGEVRNEAVSRLIEDFFDGSAENLREFLEGNSNGQSSEHDVVALPPSSTLDETLL